MWSASTSAVQSAGGLQRSQPFPSQRPARVGGARTPSRTKRGMPFSLVQSPEVAKSLLLYARALFNSCSTTLAMWKSSAGFPRESPGTFTSRAGHRGGRGGGAGSTGSAARRSSSASRPANRSRSSSSSSHTRP